MPVFTVHMPPTKAAQSRPDPDRFAFVRDGFSFWAFLLGPIWMLWHGLWLVLLGYLILAAALGVGLQAIGASTPLTVAVAVLLATLVGLEAPTLWRFTLARRRWENIGIVVGDDLESAERRFFHEWKAGEPHLAAASSTGAVSASGAPVAAGAAPASEVFGLFPQSGGWR